VNEGTKENIYDKQLTELNIHSYYIFKIEVKAADQEFEEYNPNWKFLRVLTWDKLTQWRNQRSITAANGPDDDQEDSDEAEFVFELKDAESYPFEVIKIDSKEATVADLEVKIAEAVNIPVERMIIMLRHE